MHERTVSTYLAIACVILLASSWTVQARETTSPGLAQAVDAVHGDGGSVEVILVLREDALPAAAAVYAAEPLQRSTALAELTSRLLEDLEPLGVAATWQFRYLPLVAVRIPPQHLAALEGDPRVSAVAPVRTVRTMRREGRELMGVPAVHAAGWTGAGVGVAVLDTGVDPGHSELSPGGETPGAKTIMLFDAINPGSSPRDEEGHGTAVAGIAAGSNRGTAPEATVVNVRVLNKDGEGTSAQVLAGLDAVLASVIEGNPFNIRLANLSLGGYDDEWPPGAGACDHLAPDFAIAFELLVEAGVLVVAAAGNGGCTGGVAWPACVSSAMAVGAVYDDRICTLPLPPPFGCASYRLEFGAGECTPRGCSDSTRADRITCYSDSGETLDVWAPSHCADTTRKGGGTESCFGGTSAAAPYVAGVAALLAQAFPGSDPASLRRALTETGTAITDDRNGITRNRVDAAAALGRLQELCAAPGPPAAPNADHDLLCERQALAVSWSAVSGATSYALQMADNAGFADALSVAVSQPSAEVVWPGNEAATLYLRVQAISGCGEGSPWSGALTVAYLPVCPGEPFMYVVPGITGRRSGLAGAVWFTDLALLNAGANPATFSATFHGESNSWEAEGVLAPGTGAVYRPVLEELFGSDKPESGMVVVAAGEPLHLLAHTYSRREADGRVFTYGQSIPAFGAGDALPGGAAGHLLGLRSDGEWRTNLELVNSGPVTATVTVQVFSPAGAPLGSPLTLTLQPGERQLRTRIVPAGHRDAFARVEVTGDGARVIGYASVVDGATNDPTTIPLVR